MLEQIFENRQGSIETNDIIGQEGSLQAVHAREAKPENDAIKPDDRKKDQIVEIEPQDLLEQEIIEIEEQDLIAEE